MLYCSDSRTRPSAEHEHVGRDKHRRPEECIRSGVKFTALDPAFSAHLHRRKQLVIIVGARETEFGWQKERSETGDTKTTRRVFGKRTLHVIPA